MFRNWIVSGGSVGETCDGATGTEERCYSPEIPDCVDKNKYCSYPPMAPLNGQMHEINRPADDYLTVPGTELFYKCPTANWAFNYGYDEDNFISYAFTKNVNNLTILCNEHGLWQPDYQIEGETCVNKQSEGCEKIYIPECVDRNIYCKNVTTPINASRLIKEQPNPPSENVYNTVIQFKCQEINWYFDYKLPEPFISYYYSTNIAETTLTCNAYG